MMQSSLTVRDRPWSFWGGAVLLFFFVTMMLAQWLLPDRDRDVREVVFWISMAFLAGGLFGCWRGRAARYEPQTKQLLRGGVVVRDLSRACALLLDRLSADSPAHYVYLVLGDGPVDGADLITTEQLRGQGFEVVPVAQGVPPGMARRIATGWRDELSLPVVRMIGCELEL